MSVASTHKLHVSGDSNESGVHGAVYGEVQGGTYVSLKQGADIINMTPTQAKELVLDLKKLLTLEGIA